MSFGSVLVGSSAARVVTVTNGGPGNLSITGATVAGANPGDFTITSNGCAGLALAPGASCTIGLSFAPAATSSRAATLTVADDGPGGPHGVALGGTGITRGLTFSANSLAFGARQLGTTSGARTVTLSNTGTDVVAIDTITVDGASNGDYLATSTCGATLAPAASCTISVTFAPTTIGARDATLRVADSVPGSPQSVTLGGTGVDPRAGLSVSGLDFGDQRVGATSGARTVTLTNAGTTNLSIFRVLPEGANPGDYTESDTCAGLALAPGASCPVVVTFHPSATGARPASLRIDDDDLASPQHVSLAGNGTNPVILLTPPSLGFGDQLLGTTSAVRLVTIKNTGTTDVTLSSLVIAGPNAADYTANATGCPAALAAGASCDVGVTFAPVATGARTASLVITDNAGGSPHSVSLSGNGINPIVGLSPGSLAFGDQQLGATSAPRGVTLTNNGTTPLTIGSIVVTGAAAGDYVASSTCGATVAPGANCAITVTFTPGAILGRNAAVTITDNAGGSPRSVPLSGNGINPVVGLTPGTLTFSDQPLGTTSAPRTVTLTNNGTTPLTIGGIGVVGLNPGDAPGDFTQSNTCGASLAPGASCAITLGFAPTAINGRAASVRITDNAAGGAQFIPLAGNGINPIPAFGPAALDFGQVYTPDPELGTRTVTKTVALTNTGTTPLGITSITVGGVNGGDFTQSNTCGVSLAPGAACAISVAFSPGAILDRNAAIVVTDNAAAGGGTQTVPLHGFGINPQGLFSTGNVDFGIVTLGSSSTRPVTLTNTGTTNLNISNVSIHGLGVATAATRRAHAIAAPAPFDDFSADTSACPAAVAPAARCVVAVTFRPTHTDPSGPRTDLLEIDDNTQFNGGRQLVALTGRGLNQQPTFNPPGLRFGDVPTGVTNTRLVTVTNPGSADLHISAISVDGPAAGAFGLPASSGSALPPCSTSTPLGPGASCAIAVTFTPSTTGALTATLHLSDDAVGSPQGVSLSGNGTNSRATFSPPSLSFTNTPVAVSDTVTRTITVSDTGTTPLTVTGVTLNDPNALGYSESDNCRGQTIPPGQACTITVTLTPVTTTNGITDTSASLQITDNSRNSPEQPITLSAITGRPTTYFGNIDGTTLRFPNTVAGASSATRPVTLTNSSGRCYETSGGFFCSPSYELLLPAGAVTLGGPNAGDFTINADGCSAPSGSPYRRVDPGKGCGVTVSFTPLPGATGTVSATLTYNDNASNAPQVLTLYGTAFATTVRVRPPTLDTFYPCNSGYFNAPCETRTVTVTNNGPSSLSITSTSFDLGSTSPFTIPSGGDGCSGRTIPVSGTCAIAVALNTSVVSAAYNQGQRSGTDTLKINDNAVDANGANPQPVPLEWSDIGLSPRGIDFGTVPVNTLITRTVTISVYDGSAPTVGPAVLGGDNPGAFTIVNDGCNNRSLYYSSCTVTVGFTPTVAGALHAELLITDTATPYFPHDVTLDGVGTNVVASVSPSKLTFPDTISGTVSTSVVTVTNNSSGSGDNSLVISGASITGANAGDFHADASACQGMAFGPGASCQVTVSFTPTMEGARNATLVISDNTSPQQVSLSGNGTVPRATPTPSPLNLGTVAVSDTVTRTVTVSSTGTGNLQVYSATISGPNAGDFRADASGCQGMAFQPGASCPIIVTLTPTDVMTRSATLLVYDNAPDSPQAVPLTGQGERPTANYNPFTYSYDRLGPVLLGSVATTTVPLNNNGPGRLVIPANGVSLSGPNAGYFQIVNDGCSSTAVAGGCSVVVAFNPPSNPPPGSSSTYPVTLSTADNASNTPQTVTLYGIEATNVRVAPSSLSFCYGPGCFPEVVTQTVAITNDGPASLQFDSIMIDEGSGQSSQTGDFTIVDSPPGQAPSCRTTGGGYMTVASGNTCYVTVTFTPQPVPSPGVFSMTRTAQIDIGDNGFSAIGNDRQTVPLTGTINQG